MTPTRWSILSAAVEALPDPVERSAERLRERGHEIERCEFPPPPFPGLWLVDGRELTEAQVVDFARREE